MNVVELTAHGVAYGGAAVATIDGKVVFIDGALPGDHLRCQITHDGARFCRAVVREVLARPRRQTPLCTVFGQCGGCHWQEVEPDVQRAWKREFLVTSLQRIAKLPELAARVPPLVAAPASYHYRSRALLRGRVFSDGRIGLGFFRAKSNTWLEVPGCCVLAEPLDRVLRGLTSHRLAPPLESPVSFRLRLEQFASGVTALFEFPAGGDPQVVAELGELAARLPGVIWAGQRDRCDVPALALDSWRGVTFYARPGQFWQSHRSANALLLGEVVAYVAAQVGVGAEVLDLFCGNGNIALVLAAAGYPVLGVESNPDAVATAVEAARYLPAGSASASFVAADAAAFLHTRPRRPKVVVVDPPRAGLAACTEGLRRLGAEFLVYVACDPNTLARDLRALSGDYVWEKVQGFDFFPQTYHVECVVMGRRR